MSVNIDHLLDTNSVVLQRRIKRYDVSWGRPVNALTYKRVMLSASPAYYFKMEDSTISENIGYTGTAYNITYTPPTGVSFATGVADPLDAAATFGGTAYGLPASHQADTYATNGLSLTAWIYLSSNVTTRKCVVSKGRDFGSATYPYALTVTNAHQANEVVLFGQSSQEIRSTFSLTLNAWHFVAVVVTPVTGTNPNVDFYVDGVVVKSITGQANIAPQVAVNEEVFVGAYYTGSALTTASRFIGTLDEVAVFYSPLSQELILSLYSMGIASTYLEPDEDFDNDVLGSVSVPVTYPGSIINSGPLHYWTQDATRVAAGPTYFTDDSGSSVSNLQQHGYCTNHFFASAIVGYGNPANNYAEPYASRNSGGIYGQSYAESADSLSLGTAGDVTPITIEFWLQLKEYANDAVIMGFNSTDTLKSGFSITHTAGYLYFTLYAKAANNSLTMQQLTTFVGASVTGPKLQLNKYYHIVITIDANGYGVIYQNTAQMASKQFTIARGLVIPPTTGRFVLGQTTGNVGKPGIGTTVGLTPAWYCPIWLDEVALYNKVIAHSDIIDHYTTALYGPYYKSTVIGTDPTAPGSPYILNTNEYTELVNGEDITRFVESYTYDQDIRQLVGTASLKVYESWGEGNIATKLNANTYVTIEERYTSLDESYDSGWVSRGHYLVEGPVGASTSGAGQRVYIISLRNLLKVLNFDLAHTTLQPDVLFQPKRQFDQITTFSDYRQYQFKHDVVTGAVYQNWVPTPSLKLWVTDLQNVGDATTGGSDDPKEELRIRGSAGAVQVLYGSGSVNIDNNFLLDQISFNGLGNPSTVFGEVYRSCDINDVEEDVTIDSVYFTSGKWYVGTSLLKMRADNKTMFIQSGTAKGKMFRIRQYGSINNATSTPTLGRWTAGANTALAGSTLGNWTNVNNCCDNDLTTFSTLSGTCNLSSTQTKTSNYLTAKSFSVPRNVPGVDITDYADNSVVTGIEVILRRRTNTGLATVAPNLRAIRDNLVYLSKNGTLTAGMVSSNRAKTDPWVYNAYSGGPVPPDFDVITYGGPGDTWGWGTLTIGDLKAFIDGLTFFMSVKSVTDGTGPNATINFANDVAEVTVRFYISDLQRMHVVDMNGYPISPLQEGLVVGTVFKLGDYNSVEDAYRKVLVKNGFQENDPDLPFYFQLDPCPNNIAPSVVPLVYHIDDGKRWLEVAQDISAYAPPDYRLYQDTDGVIRASLVGLTYIQAPKHRISNIMDMNEDKTDYGISTRIIAQGQGGISTNVGLSKSFGGFSAVHAYKLNNFATNVKDLNGSTKTQSDADAVLTQAFDGSPKTPIPPGTSWLETDSLGNPTVNDYYGLIYSKYGLLSDVKRWNFQDEDICAIDIGKTSDGKNMLIEALDFVWFNHYLEGSSIPQTMYVYYMTNDDYFNDMGKPAPTLPDDTDTSYFPPTNSESWKLLVDEFALSEGTTTIESSNFVGGRPLGMRFIKFRCGQCHYRFPIVVTTGQDLNHAYARFTLAEVNVWNSRNISATAELGVAGAFGTGNYKELATRVRRRTDVLPLNLYLDTYQKAKDFANSELQERYIDFSPVAVTAYAPTVDAGDSIRIRHPETGVYSTYLVTAVSHSSDGSTRMQLLNFSIST